MLTVTQSSVPALHPTPAVLPETRFWLEAGPYGVRLAQNEREREAAYRLRFLVFNLELNEGLESAYIDGFDRDPFDQVCEHLIVEDRTTGAVVGTYRLQLGSVAGRHFGYYSEREFCFKPFAAMRHEIVELGRACIHRDHRSPEVLHLLWRGIARYALRNGARYMMGCCSLTSQDVNEGHAVYRSLVNCMTSPELLTVATPEFALPPASGEIAEMRAPKLLRAYLAIGARVCSEPAIDREFKTIDFLTLLDLATLNPRVAARFLPAAE